MYYYFPLLLSFYARLRVDKFIDTYIFPSGRSYFGQRRKKTYISQDREKMPLASYYTFAFGNSLELFSSLDTALPHQSRDSEMINLIPVATYNAQDFLHEAPQIRGREKRKDKETEVEANRVFSSRTLATTGSLEWKHQDRE